ncbi:E3 ubiquitin-protein ligase TRIM7-like [Pyxicephalus adspersus]|uniref:E3 ubiquitin-protein ligase TRIM7-like n=1 Tax=Pyxicephalus adspersus TaxID=30357 RepID=UPI003B5BD097
MKILFHCITGEHRGHQVETLHEASIKKKKNLINNLQKLITRRAEIEGRVRNLEEHRRKVQGKANAETERILSIFTNLRKHLEDLEERILSEISGKAERLSLPLSNLIQDLEMKKDELSRKMRDVEELCNVTDPLIVLQESGDLCDTGDGDEKDRYDKLTNDGGDLDVFWSFRTLRTGLSEIITDAVGGIYIEEAVDILLDEDTASNDVCISCDRTTVTRAGAQNRPFTLERFEDHPQVLGTRSFSSGRHYWEVNVQASNNWRIGCYSSIDREGDDSLIGGNCRSWGLYRRGGQYSVVHGGSKDSLPDNITSNRVRIYLDYEAGQISFYDLSDPIRHIHTFTTTFTEPLYAVLGVRHAYISLCGRKT